jgi:hypothetical protein
MSQIIKLTETGIRQFFQVASTQYRSYDDSPTLLASEDIRCTSVHYFRHNQAPEENNERLISKLDSFITGNNPQTPTRLGHTAMRGQWFEVNDIKHSATDALSALIKLKAARLV